MVKIDKFLCLFLILFSLPALATSIYPGYKVASWQVTEWLINYQGGFVRRGLPGEIIFVLASHGINPYFVVISSSLVIWLLLFLIIFKLSIRRQFSLLIICSQLCLLAPVIGHVVVRKDCLIILCFVLALFFFQQKGFKSTLMANSISAFAVLSHEVYGFISIPLFFIVKYAEPAVCLSNDTGNSAKSVICRLFYAVTCMSPLLFLFGLSLGNAGNQSIADQVWNSWHDNLEFFPGSSDPGLDAPPASIQALGWSLARALQGPLWTLQDFSFIAWLITAAVVAFYLLLLQRSHLMTLKVPDMVAKEESTCLVRILACQFAAILPVCLVSWDYGRLIFLWATSSIGAFLILTPGRYQAIMKHVFDAHSSVFPTFVQNFFSWTYGSLANGGILILASSRRIVVAKLLLLFFAIPICCWDLVQYVAYTPIVQPFYYAINVLEFGWGPPARLTSLFECDKRRACAWNRFLSENFLSTVKPKLSWYWRPARIEPWGIPFCSPNVRGESDDAFPRALQGKAAHCTE
jgi:hypothetical protein